MPWSRFVAYGGYTTACLFLSSVAVLAQTTILNVSYDVSRELYKDINPAFIADRKAKTGETIIVNQSHGGSSKQALSVTAGLEADVVTMNQAPDIDILVERGGYVATDWRKHHPHDASPYTTTTVFLVRKGNPKGIKDWDDLVSAGLPPRPPATVATPIWPPGATPCRNRRRVGCEGLRDKALCQRSRARRRRARGDHHLHAT